jgi:FkbM family methyltransferase
MSVTLLKRLAALLPVSSQQELRRHFFRHQIKRRRFFTHEKEYAVLGNYLRPGSWVLDIGANVGHYAMRMSELVGPAGRVIAFEPVPDTFALLAANSRWFAHNNVSLLNVAVSETFSIAGMVMPSFTEGLPNYYEAHLTSEQSGLSVLTLPVDSLVLPQTVALIKIDVEGHELSALRGMRKLLMRDHPPIILETGSDSVVRGLLEELGYATERLPGSSNLICTAISSAAISA